MFKKIIITIVIISFFVLNYFTLKAFYYNYNGDTLLKKNGFTGSIVEFENSGNKEGIYNKANSLYKQNDYKESIVEYISILGEENNILNFNINHNIANNFYKLGENESNGANKIQNWEKSVEYYRDALNIKYNNETKENLEFVLEKIKEEKNKENENEENKDDSEDNEGEEIGEGDKKDEEGENKEGNESGENKKEENNLTKNQEEALKQYEKALNDEQKKNANDFNKVYEEKNNDPFGNFFNDPFFDNKLLDGGNEKKDW